MAKAKTVEMDRTDLSTLLGCLASDLRNAGLAVRGVSYRRGGSRGAGTFRYGSVGWIPGALGFDS